MIRERTRERLDPRHALRRRRAPASEPDAIRVRLGIFRRQYAYSCPGARLGDVVRVAAPFSGVVETTVVALGRGGYHGPLKRAELVR